MLFFQEGKAANEIYAFTIGGRAYDGSGCVGSGSHSRYRAGACVRRGGVLPEDYKGNHKSLAEHISSVWRGKTLDSV